MTDRSGHDFHDVRQEAREHGYDLMRFGNRSYILRRGDRDTRVMLNLSEVLTEVRAG